MKKLTSLLLAAALVPSLAACGSSEKPDTTNEETTEVAEVEKEPEKKAVDGTLVETKFFTLAYGDGWNLDMESSDYGDREEDAWATIRYADPDNEEETLVYIEITAKQDEPLEFAENLKDAGWDPEKVIKGEETVPTRTIGGIEFYELEQYGAANYYGYKPEGNVFYTIFVNKTSQMDLADKVIDTIEFPEVTYDDDVTPWYWEGTAFALEDREALAGTIKVSAKAIPLSESMVTWDLFSPQVAVVGDKAYLLVDDVLYQYAYDGNEMKFEKIIEEGSGFDLMQSAGDTLWLSGFGDDLTGIKNGEVVATYDDTDYFYIAPSGDWGISFFTQPEVEKVTLGSGSASKETLTLAGMSSVSEIFVDNDHIYAAGRAEEDDKHKVFVYDTSGNLQTTLAGKDADHNLGSMTFVTSTDNGYLGMDGNMRKVVLWDKDGSWVGEIDDGDLFGTYYPWFAASTKLSDGSVMTVMVDERQDHSADEAIVFVLSGY